MNHFKRWAAITISAALLWSGAMACSGGGGGGSKTHAPVVEGGISGKLPSDTPVDTAPVVTPPVDKPPVSGAPGNGGGMVAGGGVVDKPGTGGVKLPDVKIPDVKPPDVKPPAPVACTYVYSDWSACQADNTQTKTVTSSSPAGCTGSPVLSQSCVYVPPVVPAKPVIVVKLQGYDLNAGPPLLPANTNLLFDLSGTTGVDLVLDLLKITGSDNSVVFNNNPQTKQMINFPKGDIYTVIFQATANGGTDSKTYKIQIVDKPIVKPEPKVPSATLTGVENNKAYLSGGFNFGVINSVNVASYRWELSGGGLASLDKQGMIDGKIIDPSIDFKVEGGKLIKECLSCDKLSVVLPEPQVASDAYTMTVTVKSSTGDTATSALAFTVLKPIIPSATITATLDGVPMVDNEKYKMGALQFTSTSEKDVVQRQWSLENFSGSEGSFAPALVAPASDTSYTVFLTLTSSTGHADKKSFNFTILQPDKIPLVTLMVRDALGSEVKEGGKYAAGQFTASVKTESNVQSRKWALTVPDGSRIEGGAGESFLPNPTMVADPQQEVAYKLSLEVTSSTNNHVTREVSFTIVPKPIPAITADDITITSGMALKSGIPITLHGKTSQFATEYRWVIEPAVVGELCGEKCVNQSDFAAAQESTMFVPFLPGGYKVTLFAKGIGGTARTVILIKTAGPLVAQYNCILSNGNDCVDQGIYPITTFRFNGASSIPATGIESYEWLLDDKVVATYSSAADLYKIMPAAIGDYTVALRVKKDGFSSLSKTMTLHVVAPPKIVLFSSGVNIEQLLIHPYTYYADEERTLDASKTTGADVSAFTITVTSPIGKHVPNKSGTPAGIYKFTPNVKGTYKIHVHAAGAGGVDDKNYSLDILAAD